MMYLHRIHQRRTLAPERNQGKDEGDEKALSPMQNFETLTRKLLRVSYDDLQTEKRRYDKGKTAQPSGSKLKRK
jgi:hypothetical protein